MGSAATTTDLVLADGLALEAHSPRELWDIAEAGAAISKRAWELADGQLRAWVLEGKTQTWMAEQVGRSVSRINQRCIALGLQSKSNRGRPRISSTGNSNPEPDSDDLDVADAEGLSAYGPGDDTDGEEPVEGEIVEPDARTERQQQIIDKARDRLETLVGSLDGYVVGLPSFNVQTAVRDLSPERRAGLLSSLDDVIEAFDELRKRIKEAS